MEPEYFTSYFTREAQFLVAGNCFMHGGIILLCIKFPLVLCNGPIFIFIYFDRLKFVYSNTYGMLGFHIAILCHTVPFTPFCQLQLHEVCVKTGHLKPEILKFQRASLSHVVCEMLEPQKYSTRYSIF